jgi:hypothetical protein
MLFSSLRCVRSTVVPNVERVRFGYRKPGGDQHQIVAEGYTPDASVSAEFDALLRRRGTD